MRRACSSFIALASILALGCGSSPSRDEAITDAGHRSDVTARVDASLPREAATALIPTDADVPVQTYAPVDDAGCGSASALIFGGCGDPESDPHNCGSCGHDCDGGACFDGSCGPLPAGVLATGQYGPTALFVDGENAFWRNEGYAVGAKTPAYLGGQVLRCALSGCGNRPTVLAAAPPGPEGAWRPRTVALDDARVYWTQDESIVACAKTGCACTPDVVLPVVGASELAVHGSTLYFTDPGANEVRACPVTGCENATVLAGHPVAPQGIVADDASVYWTTLGSGVLSCALGGCNGGPETLWSPTMNPTSAVGIAVDATNLYWTNANGQAGSVMQCAKADCGGTLKTLATGRESPSGIAVDATNVYWSEGTGFVKCVIGGCGGQPTTIASTRGTAVAVDGTRVYLAQQASPTDGWIVAQPK